MAYKDKDKEREYQKQYRRMARANAKLGKPTSGRAATARTKAIRSVTTTRTTYEGPIDLVARLEQFDGACLDLGEKLLELAKEAAENVDTEKLDILDMKRLVEIGFKLRDKGAKGLEKQETKEEQAIFVTEDVIGNPAFLGAAHTMLELSAADDLAKFVDGSAASPADSSILCALHESTGVDPVPPPSSP